MKPSELPEVFQENLRAARLRSGLSQRRLAMLVECSPNSIVEWETGKASPSLNSVHRLGKALGISSELLLVKFCSEPVQLKPQQNQSSSGKSEKIPA
ncbi:helix-turn-helix domain protein [Planctopirus limnophila DSM 3776]|uniref:Helix-turn-helix domain protein n=1 Tax=Planctopirus limnophila (strain ATCC 43296 / DSM 3776 / IFAM 1008 / Mu 290) TaxID=521674 RepID=D5SMR4_PLAL2|nr:helix-turn-helix domain protein [Planctopirus limnophila DSM 3776]